MDCSRDPNIEALKKRGCIDQGLTSGFARLYGDCGIQMEGLSFTQGAQDQFVQLLPCPWPPGSLNSVPLMLNVLSPKLYVLNSKCLNPKLLERRSTRNTSTPTRRISI